MKAGVFIGLAGVAALSSVVVLSGGPASADDFRGHNFACQSSIVGTYLTTIEGKQVSGTFLACRRGHVGVPAMTEASKSRA